MAVSGSVGIGTNLGAAAAIGGAVARNYIGYDADGDRVESWGQVQAYIKDTPATASAGALDLIALSEQTVIATTVAGSVAVSGSSSGSAFSISGAGSSSFNQIAATVKAYIDGDGTELVADDGLEGIAAESISLIAEDISTIRSVTVGASIAAAVALDDGAGGALAIGISLSKNIVSNDIEASVSNADSVESVGNVDIRAVNQSSINNVAVAASVAAGISTGGSGVAISGAGADAINIIDTKANAFLESSTLTSTNGDVTIKSDTSPATGSETLTPVNSLDLNDDDDTDDLGESVGFTAFLDDAATIDLLDADETIGGTEYKAFTPDPRDFEDDNIIKTALRNNLSNINIEMSSDPNDIAVTIRKKDSNGTPVIESDDTGIEWSVTDRSTGLSVIIVKDIFGNFKVSQPQITAVVVGVSVAVAVGKDAGIGIAIGVSLARNLIGSEQDALGEIRNVSALISRKSEAAQSQARIIDSDVIAPAGTLTLDATGQQSIDSFVGSFVLAVGIATGNGVGFAGAGAGARATNGVAINVKATIDSDSAAKIDVGALDLSATDASTIKAVTGTVAVAFSYGGSSGAVSLAVGVSIAENVILNEVDAHIDNANVANVNDQMATVSTGAVSVTASESASIDSVAFAATAAFAAAAGNFSLSVGVLVANNEIFGNISAYIASGAVDASSITIAATNSSRIDSTTFVLSLSTGFAIGVGVGSALSTIGGTVSAYGDLVTLTTSTGDVTIEALSNPTVEVTSTAVAASLGVSAGVAVFDATTIIRGETKAYLIASTLNAGTNDINVRATSNYNMTPEVRGGAGGLISVGAMISEVVVGGSTTVELDGQSRLTADDINFVADDTSCSKLIIC